MVIRRFHFFRSPLIISNFKIRKNAIFNTINYIFHLSYGAFPPINTIHPIIPSCILIIGRTWHYFNMFWK